MKIKSNDDPKKLKWEQTRLFINDRDKTCRIWAILTVQEKLHINKNFREDYNFLSKFLDCCHIIPKSVKASLYYEPTNIVLCSRFFHGRLDEFRHPVYNTKITKDEKYLWFRSALAGKRLIEESS